MNTGVGGLFGPRPRRLTWGFVSGVGAQTGRKVGGEQEVDSEGGLGVQEIGSQRRNTEQRRRRARRWQRCGVVAVCGVGGVGAQRWLSTAVSDAAARMASAASTSRRSWRHQALVSARASTAIAVVVAVGLQAPFWVVAALVVAPRLVLADLLLVVAAARATLSCGTGRTSLRLRHDHRSRRTLGDRDWCRVALKQCGEACRGVVLGDVVHVDHRRGDLGVAHHGHHV